MSEKSFEQLELENAALHVLRKNPAFASEAAFRSALLEILSKEYFYTSQKMEWATHAMENGEVELPKIR